MKARAGSFTSELIAPILARLGFVLTIIALLLNSWRIPARILDSSVYSTAALLDTSIPFLELLPSGQQVRTLVSSEQRGLRNSQRAGRWSTTQEASSSSAEEAPEGSLAHVHHLDENTARMKENAAERVDEVLLRWSVQVWEAYVEALDEEAALGVTIPDSSVRLSSPPVRASMNEAHLDVPPALGPLLSLLLDMLTSVGTSLSGSASDRATLRGSGKHVDTLMLCGGKLRISAEELASASWRTTQPEGHGEAHRVPHQPRGSKSTRYGLDHDGARVELDLPNQDGQGTLSDLSPQIVPGPESTQARLRFALVHLLSRCAVTQRNINPIFVNWVEPSMPSEPELGAWSNIAGGNGSESVTGRFHQLQTRMEKLERATERLERGMTILLERLTAPPPPAPPHPPPTSAQQGTFGTGTKQRSTATSPTSPRAQMVPVSPTQTRTQGQGQDDWSRPAPQARHRRSGSSETPDLGTEPSQIQTHSGNASSKGPSSKPNKSSSASSPIAAALPTNGGTAAPSAAVAAAIPKTTTATTTTSEAVQRARALDESRNTRDWLEDRLPGPAAALPLMVFFAVGLVLWRLVPGLFPI